MTNRKGPLWEVRLLNHLRGQRFDVERLRLTGKEDEGDLVVKDDGIVVIEAKDDKSFNISGWVRESEVEAVNYAKHRGLDPREVTPIVVVKRRNQPVGKSYVVMTLDTFFDLD